MSIYGDSYHVKKVGSLGIEGFLVKPFSRRLLLERINDILQNTGDDGTTPEETTVNTTETNLDENLPS